MRFIFIDKIDSFRKNKFARMLKAVTMSEDYFEEHFPNFPVVPGALILEAFEQGGFLSIVASLDFLRMVRMVSIRNAKFKRFVLPGDLVKIELDVKSILEEQAVVFARGMVGDKEIARAELTFKIFNKEVSDEAKNVLSRLKSLFEILVRNNVRD